MIAQRVSLCGLQSDVRCESGEDREGEERLDGARERRRWAGTIYDKRNTIGDDEDGGRRNDNEDDGGRCVGGVRRTVKGTIG